MTFAILVFQTDDEVQADMISDENDLASLLTLNQIADLHPNMNSDLPMQSLQLPTDLELSLLPSRSRGRYEEILNDLSNFIEMGEQEFGPTSGSSITDTDNDVIIPQLPDQQDLDYALIHDDAERDYPYHIHSPRLRSEFISKEQTPSEDSIFYDSNSNYITAAEFVKKSTPATQRRFLHKLLNVLKLDDSGILNNYGQDIQNYDYEK